MEFARKERKEDFHLKGFSFLSCYLSLFMSWALMAGQLGWGIMEESWRKGPWTAEEDKLLIEYVRLHGEGRWKSVARLAGLKRNGKSCRLRWVNYLRPDLKRGQITPYEESLILELHSRWGNRWSTIARSLPGRTDNEIKNYWRTHFKNKPKHVLVTPVKQKLEHLEGNDFNSSNPATARTRTSESATTTSVVTIEPIQHEKDHVVAR